MGVEVVAAAAAAAIIIVAATRRAVDMGMTGMEIMEHHRADGAILLAVIPTAVVHRLGEEGAQITRPLLAVMDLLLCAPATASLVGS